MKYIMSINAKKELLAALQIKYTIAQTRAEKTKIIDSLISIAGYERKYAIHLLNKKLINSSLVVKQIYSPTKYDQSVKLALITIWYAANQICSKRLKPFLPDFISSLERHSHLSLTQEVRDKLLNISTGTIDSLLKKQIKVRTFADWDDVVPGFFEADLVAHCGGSTNGSFLNTLTLTDISSGWTECIPLLCKNKENVIDGLRAAMEMLQFKVLGIDTDNGSEFINYALVEFCRKNNITFTRARKYKKNDQAHVEEKNGSIVRRLVGYDRFEGIDAWQPFTELYTNVRLCVNFFQSSLKLLSKSRGGSKVTKKYDLAKLSSRF
jgi:IS30 family transposase